MASCRISTGCEARAQDSAFDTGVRFRDAQDNSQVADTIRVGIRISPSPQPGGIVAFLPVLIPAESIPAPGIIYL